jgi:RNA 2',3'-cyclic 3'-phosphodiesterase
MSSEPRLRLFVAVELSEAIKHAIGELIEPLRAIEGFRWTPVENLHLTLAFLGWVHHERVQEVTARLAGAAADQVGFEARLGGAGGFPERGKARVLWVGFVDEAGELAALAAAVRRALGELFPPDERPFRPHVTVARARSGPQRVGATIGGPAGPAFGVDTITLFRSRLGGDHARYEVLERWPLGAQAARIP